MKANEILKNNTHLSITVKTNLLGERSPGHSKLWPTPTSLSRNMKVE